MGLFDRWRRKREDKRETTVKGREILTSKPPSAIVKPVRDLSPEDQSELAALVAEYERLKKRREELQQERGELTERLDRGELTPIEFRKELMSRIREASQVTEKLKSTSSRLTSMGYRGILH